MQTYQNTKQNAFIFHQNVERCVNRAVSPFAMQLITSTLTILTCVNHLQPLDKGLFILYLCIDILINQEC